MEMICCNFWVEVAEKQVFFINLLFPHPKARCRGGGANWVLEPYDWKDIEFLNYHVHQTGAPTQTIILIRNCVKLLKIWGLFVRQLVLP